MRTQRRRHWRCLFVLAFIVHLKGQASLSELPPTCDLPATVRNALTAARSADVYGAAGAWLAQHGQSGCAMQAFEISMRIDPSTWQSEYDLALLEIGTGENKRAEQHLRHITGLKPDLAPVRIALAMTLRRLNRAQEAESELLDALKTNRDSPQLLSSLAELLSSEHRYTSAIECWTHASKFDPANLDIKLSIAIATNENNETQKAIALLKALLAAKPGFQAAHFNLATIYARQSNYRSAADEYREALKLDPADDAARLLLAKTLVLLSQNQEAVGALPDYLGRHPGDFEAHYLMGVAYRELGDYQKAEPQLREAVKLNPHHGDLNYNLGFVLAHTGRPRESVAFFQKAIDLDPEAQPPRFAMATVLQGLGEEKQARQVFDEIKASKQKSALKDQASLQGNLANQYLQSNEPLKAVDLYKQMIRWDPENARTYYNLALALDQAGDRQGEREALEQSLRLDPKLAKALNQLAVLDMAESKLVDAERRLVAALESNPQLAEAHANLGVLFGRKGQLDKAEQCFRSAIEDDPHYTRAYTNYALTLAQQGRFSEAEVQAQQAANLDPREAGAFTALGMIQTRLRQGSEAVRSFRRAVELQPDHSESHLNLGIALADRYDLEGALAEFSEAVRLDPRSAIAYYNRGRVLVDTRHFVEAESDLRTADDLPGAPPDALYLLAVALRQEGQIARSYSMVKSFVEVSKRDAKGYYLMGQDLISLNREQDAINAWKEAAALEPSRTEVLYKLSQSLRKTDIAEADRYAAQLKIRLRQSQALSQADTLGNFALSAAQNHDFVQAISQLEEALIVCGDCHDRADLYKDLGLIFCQSGDLQSCELQLKEALTLKPGNPEIIGDLNLVSDLRKKP